MFYTIGQITILILILGSLDYLRKKYTAIDTYWKNGVVWLFTGIALIHTGIWWKFTNFWNEWHYQSGFLLFQIILGIGFYFVGLKDKKFLKWVGVGLILIGLICIPWGIVDAISTNIKVADVMSPKELKNLPHQNKETEKKVAEFWKTSIPDESALAMLRIVRRKSGFNQFKEDGKTPYRNPKNQWKLGVMQIDDRIWLERATELGYNIYELEGNLQFALWLYKERGMEPWDENSTTLSLSKMKDAAVNKANGWLGSDKESQQTVRQQPLHPHGSEWLEKTIKTGDDFGEFVDVPTDVSQQTRPSGDVIVELTFPDGTTITREGGKNRSIKLPSNKPNPTKVRFKSPRTDKSEIVEVWRKHGKF